MHHAAIAKALGWTVAETKRHSLPTLRDLVRPVDPELAREITETIRKGSHVVGSRAADMSWLGVWKCDYPGCPSTFPSKADAKAHEKRKHGM